MTKYETVRVYNIKDVPLDIRDALQLYYNHAGGCCDYLEWVIGEIDSESYTAITVGQLEIEGIDEWLSHVELAQEHVLFCGFE